MDIGAIAQWAATIAIAAGMAWTWRRNGRNQAEKWGSFTNEIKNLREKLDDPNQGLGAIKKSVDDQKTHCASVTSGFKERIKNLENTPKRK